MKRVGYYFLQVTWGFLQSFVGFLLWIAVRKKPHYIFHGAIVTEWKYSGSVSLGMFIFLSETMSRQHPIPHRDIYHTTLVHEYGHSVQSLFLGPLYLPVIGLPSVLWCTLPACRKHRKKKGLSYFSFYPERWANAWGEKATKEISPGQRL